MGYSPSYFDNLLPRTNIRTYFHAKFNLCNKWIKQERKTSRSEAVVSCAGHAVEITTKEPDCFYKFTAKI